MLAKLLLHSQKKIVKETAWTVSNIELSAGNAIQIQAHHQQHYIHLLADMLGKGDFKCQKEAELLGHQQHHFG
jgi:hypothetical protein